MKTTRRALIALFLAGSSAALAQPAPRVVTVRQAFDLQQAGKAVLIDIRTPAEWTETGAPKGAVRLDMTQPDFADRIAAMRRADPGKEIALICRSSNRSAHAAQALAKAGVTGVLDVAGGVAGSSRGIGWIAAGLPIEK